MSDADARDFGRIDAGPVLAEVAGAFARHAGLLPRLMWPAVLVAFVVGGLQRFALPAEAAWTQALGLLQLPFDLMLATAWVRLLLLGRAAARIPALGWGRAETDFLFQLVVFALAFLGCVVLTVLIVGNLPLPDQTRTLIVAAASWLILTLLTPLALKLPARAAGRDLPSRAWQARLGNFPNAALVWLLFLTVSFGLKLIPAQIPQDAGPALAAAGLVADLAVHYVILLGCLAVASALLRQLAGWPPAPPTEDAKRDA